MTVAAVLLVGASGPAVAEANVPAAATRTLPIMANGTQNGTLNATVEYGETTATTTALTGGTILLPAGYYWKLSTCISYHRERERPVSQCADRFVDTRSTGSMYSHAPTVQLAGRSRPGAGFAYFTPYAQLSYQSAGAYPMVAHSWPGNGLEGAGLAVAPLGQDTGSLPPNSPVGLDPPYNGQINTGQADGICTASRADLRGPLPQDLTDNQAAYAGAPAYYEVGAPSGSYAGRAPEGLMIVIHGGGWTATGPGLVEATRAVANRWRARGWLTLNVDYRACNLSIDDVVWFHDKARARHGPNAKICATGGSAGGHLALILAALRPDVYCAISEAGPTNLTSVHQQPAFNGATGRYDQTQGSRFVRNVGAAAFGAENLAAHSPVALAPKLADTRVLQAVAANDFLIPLQQVSELHAAMRAANPSAYVDSMHLAPGGEPFTHGSVSRTALDDYYAREERVAAGNRPAKRSARDRSVRASITAMRFVRKRGVRVLRIRVRLGESVAVYARLVRKGRVIATKRVKKLKPGRRTIQFRLKRKVKGGRARLKVTFRDARKNRKTIEKRVRVPRRAAPRPFRP